MAIALVPARSEHFDWLLAETSLAGPDGLWLDEFGIQPQDILLLLRELAEMASAALGLGSWLIVDGTQLVGLCGIKAPPNAEGFVEIGYGVAANHRNKGIASRAVALMKAALTELPQIHGIVAETAIANSASLRVLEHNGFERIGRRHDEEDGELFIWRWTPADGLH